MAKTERKKDPKAIAKGKKSAQSHRNINARPGNSSAQRDILSKHDPRRLWRKKTGHGVVTISPSAADVLEGKDDVTTWSDEELMHGRRSATIGKKSGLFPGNDPKVIPMPVYQEYLRRIRTKIMFKMTKELQTAADELIRIINSKHVDDAVRLQAIKFLFERIMGKVPETVDLRVGEVQKWEHALSDGIVNVVEDDDIIEGEVVED